MLVCECTVVNSDIDEVRIGLKRTLTINKISFIGEKANSYI